MCAVVGCALPGRPEGGWMRVDDDQSSLTVGCNNSQHKRVWRLTCVDGQWTAAHSAAGARRRPVCAQLPASADNAALPAVAATLSLCTAFNCRILYGYYLPTVGLLTILFGIPSPAHSFIPGLKPSFSANPSHRSLQDSLHGFSQTVYRYF